MIHQIPLAVGLRDDAAFDNYLPGPNTQARACVAAAVYGLPSEGSIYLWGGQGCGKTHLLQAACSEAGRRGLRSVYIPLGEAGVMTPEVLVGLEQMDLVCIDDLACVAADPAWEQALFHLYNGLFDQGRQLIVAADRNVGALELGLDDLASRLSWGFVYHLRQLADDDKLTALQARASARGLMLDREVAMYLLRHYPRDMQSLFDALARLDAASLAAQRRLTIPFVRDHLPASESTSNQTTLFS